MPKLSDMQLVLLSIACQRDDGSLLPPPDSIGAQAARIRKAIATLVKAGLAAEIVVPDATTSWRSANGQHFGVVISNAGRERIAPAPDEPQAHALAESTAPRSSKIASVIALMRRDQGATLTELVEATDWLPHTTRAALTGLRKKGHAVNRCKRDDITCYHIAGAA
jgi:hypothetical protein